MKDAPFSLPLLHIVKSVELDPVKKIKLFLEGIFSKIKSKDDLFNDLMVLYRIAISLDGAKKVRENVMFIPWVFAKTKENYDAYISPWLQTFPDLTFRNSLELQVKLSKIEKKEAWEQFFIITSKLGISEVAFEELKRQFTTWAMPEVMRAAGIYVEEEIKRSRYMLYPMEEEHDEFGAEF